MKKITVSRCPAHDFYAITIDDDNGCGTRVTPSKCCGRWDTTRAWELSAHDWRELSELAAQAADEAEAAPRRKAVKYGNA